MRIRILVIEDERSLAAAPWDVVLGPEYEVQIARADHLRLHICHFAPAAVIINSERRPVSNADLCREVRSCKGSAETPLLLLTRSAEESADSLNAGADDCLAKPISHQELVLRIRGLLRRAGFANSSTLRAADILLDLDRFRVTRAGHDVHLAPVEFKLLEILMRTPGRPVLRHDLIRGAWPHARIDERTVNVCIMRLRKALRRGRRTDPIRTVRGVGYCLDAGECFAPHSKAQSRSNGGRQSATRPRADSGRRLPR
jgi:two-component system phosphate regulon response regulator PhoB